MLCSELSLVNRSNNRLNASVLKCKCWNCDLCEPGRRERVRRIALAGEPTKFLTLTVNPACGIDENERAKALVWAWRLLVKRIARRQKVKKIEYLWVMESTKAGEPHMHVLMRSDFIEQAWLSDVMRELINAPIVHIRRVDHKGSVARYVSKYCSKDLAGFHGCKRFGYTRGWIINNDYFEEMDSFKSEGWQKCALNIGTIERELLFAGFAVEKDKYGNIVADAGGCDESDQAKIDGLWGRLATDTLRDDRWTRGWTDEAGDRDGWLKPDVDRTGSFKKDRNKLGYKPWEYKPRWRPPEGWTREVKKGKAADNKEPIVLIWESVHDV